MNPKIVYHQDRITISYQEDYINDDINHFRRKVYRQDGSKEWFVDVKDGRKHGIEQRWNRVEKRNHIKTFFGDDSSWNGLANGVHIEFVN